MFFEMILICDKYRSSLCWQFLDSNCFFQQLTEINLCKEIEESDILSDIPFGCTNNLLWCKIHETLGAFFILRKGVLRLF